MFEAQDLATFELRMLGRYWLRGVVGEGAFGQIYDARDMYTREILAVKAIRPDRTSADQVRRFHRERRILARLQPHPHIVRLVNHGVDPEIGQGYIAMELLRGRTLRRMLDDGAALSVEHACRLALHAGKALEHASRLRVNHFDVQPKNIVVTDQDGALVGKLIDFGLANFSYEDVSHDFGNRPYMAPERFRGEGDRRSDVYSVGAIVYEMITGAPAFPFGRDRSTALPSRFATEPSAVGDQLWDFVEQCLEFEPENRYREWSEVTSALEEAAAAAGGAVARRAAGAALGRRRPSNDTTASSAPPAAADQDEDRLP